MVLSFILLIIGFALLVKGADVFVTGSSAIAQKFHIPQIIIGLTIVALGTSAPEIAVSTVASLKGSNEMAISNIIGSNFFNILVVLGVCALINPVKVDKGLLIKEIPFSLLATFVLVVMCTDVFLNNATFNEISRGDGLVLLMFFAIFLYSIISYSLSNKDNIVTEIEENHEKEISTKLAVVFTFLGLIAIVLGGDVVVKSASKIALNFHVSETLIGLTIVALGTSLPELVTSIIATKKGKTDIAIGNVIGSNIFNILLTLGISASISPIEVGIQSIIDVIVLAVISLLVYFFAVTSKKISRFEGGILVLIYIVYMVFAIIRS